MFARLAEEQLTVAGHTFVIGSPTVQGATIGGTTFSIVHDGSSLQIDVTSGTGVHADWQSLLSGITYEHTGVPTAGERSFVFQLTDTNGGLSNVVESRITVSKR